MRFILAMLLLFSVTVLSAKEITLTEQNTMSLNGPVDGNSMTSLMVELQRLNKIETSDPIYLVLNTPGGSVYDGFDFIRFAQTSKRKVHTITIFAASMGFQIVESLGSRYVTSYSTLMSHKVKGGFGNTEMPGQLDSRYGHLLSHIREQDSLVVSRTNGKQTLATYANLIQNEYWANSGKSITDGFADEEVSPKCDKSLEATHVQYIDFGFFALNVEFSNCPLITSPVSISIASGASYIFDKSINVNAEFRKIFDAKNFTY